MIRVDATDIFWLTHPSFAKWEFSGVGMFRIFPIDLHLEFALMFAWVLLLDWVFTITVIPIKYKTTFYTTVSINIKTRFKEFWAPSCLWNVKIIGSQAGTLWFNSKEMSSMWYLLLYIYYLQYCKLSKSSVYQFTFNLTATRTKQMPMPFLILKLAWSNNNKMKYSKITFEMQVIKFHLSKAKGEKTCFMVLI